MNLGAALASVGRGTEAAAVLRAGASLDGSGLKDKRAHEAARVQALLQLGALYADQGRLQRALSAYREALHALPDHYPPQVSVQITYSLLLHLRRAATYGQAAALRIPAFPLTNRLPSNRFVKGICTIDFTGNYATCIFSDRVSCYLTRYTYDEVVDRIQSECSFTLRRIGYGESCLTRFAIIHATRESNWRREGLVKL